MSQVDLTTHSAAIKEAFDKVRNNQGIDWMLLDYEGKSNTLKVSGTGNGGLDELEEEFNDGKIEFAFVRVVDENTQLHKFVLISWCGEGVPEIKKGTLQIHSQVVEKQFKGYHVHINARSNKDVDKASIMKKVKDSSGANYSFHKEQAKPQVPDKPQAVGSNYQKPEIMGRSKDVSTSSFTKPAVDPLAEKRRVEEERKRQEEEEKKRHQEEERRKQEEERKRHQEEEARRNASAQQAAAAQRKEEESRKHEQEKKQKEEQERRQKEEQEKAKKQKEEQERRQKEEEEKAKKQQEAAKPAPPPAAAAGKTAVAQYDYDAADGNEISFHVGETITEIQEVDENWWQGYNSQGLFGMFPSAYVSVGGAAPHVEEAAPVPAPVEVEEEAPAASGTTAIALYEYAAGDDGEISFQVDELITEIQPVDENWWQGKNAQGYFGMFPSNYVQLQ